MVGHQRAQLQEPKEREIPLQGGGQLWEPKEGERLLQGGDGNLLEGA